MTGARGQEPVQSEVLRCSSTTHMSEPGQSGCRESVGTMRKSGSYPVSTHNRRLSLCESLRETRGKLGRAATAGGGWLTEIEQDGSTRDVPPGSATLANLFLSGKCATIKFDDDESALGSSTKTPLELLEMEDLDTFPDPPCVLPFDPQGEGSGQETYRAPSGTPMQSYWKGHADFRGGGRQVEEARRLSAAFAEAWRRPGADVCTAWVNASASAVAVRAAPTPKASAAGSVRPGQCIMVQSVEEVDGVNLLELADEGGWLLDSTDSQAAMVEMKELEAGSWWHRLVCEECVDVRGRPVYDAQAKTGRFLSPGELTVVDLRCRVRGSSFVRLMDGRGWVFVQRPGNKKNDHSRASMVMEECDSEIQEGPLRVDLRSLIPPTHLAVEVGHWTYTVGHEPVLAIGSAACGTFLNPGDIIKVDKRAYAHGDAPRPGIPAIRWLRLSDMRGWVMEVDGAGKELLQERKLSEMSYPSWFVGTPNIDHPQEEWMVGKA